MHRSLIAATLIACAAPLPAAPSVDDLAFLTGRWQGPMFRGTYVARYTAPGGGLLLSFSELKREGETASYEFERFESDGTTVVFTPYAAGKAGTPLRLVDLDADARRAVFENPDKDFPTRIVYHRVADDRLLITLSDPHGTSDRELVYDLKRVD